MKMKSLRAASPRFIHKMLIQSGLHDAWCVLKFCSSSPLTHCAPLNYCRWVKAKIRNSVMCARVRGGFSAGFPDLASCDSEGDGRGWGRWAESSPISWKSAQRLSRVFLLFPSERR